MKMGLGIGLQRRGGGNASGPAVTALVATATGGTTAQLDITASAGTLYWYISTSATPPSVANIKVGTGAASFGSYTHPGTFTGPTGLTASTTYYPYALVNDGVSDSEIYAGASFTTEVADVTAPSLTSPGATVLDTTSADMTVTTNEGRGTLWAIASTVNSAPSAAQIKLGQDGSGTTTNVAFAAGGGSGVNVSAIGVQTITATGLTEVAHYGFFYQEDPTTNGSSVVATGAFTPADVTAPTLSSFDLSLGTDPAFSGTLNTDEGNGTLDVVLADPSNAPNATQIKAGQDHTGATAAGRIAAQAVSTTGPQSLSGTATANGTWRGYAVATDAAGNVGDVLASDATIVVAAAAAAFAPADLFASSEEGLAFEVNTSKCFTDSVGGTAASVTDAVAAVEDISGNTNHLSPLGGPVLQQEGTGEYYLAMDGTNDGIPFPADITGSEARTIILGIKADEAAGATASLAIFTLGGNLSNTGEAWALYHESSLALRVGGNKIFNAALGTSAAVVLTNYWATSLGTGVVDDAVLRIDGTALGQTSATGATINTTPATFAPRIAAWNSGGTESDNLQCRIYAGIIINRLLTAGELSDAEAWVAARIP